MQQGSFFGLLVKQFIKLLQFVISEHQEAPQPSLMNERDNSLRALEETTMYLFLVDFGQLEVQCLVIHFQKTLNYRGFDSNDDPCRATKLCT